MKSGIIYYLKLTRYTLGTGKYGIWIPIPLILLRVYEMNKNKIVLSHRCFYQPLRIYRIRKARIKKERWLFMGTRILKTNVNVKIILIMCEYL